MCILESLTATDIAKLTWTGRESAGVSKTNPATRNADVALRWLLVMLLPKIKEASDHIWGRTFPSLRDMAEHADHGREHVLQAKGTSSISARLTCGRIWPTARTTSTCGTRIAHPEPKAPVAWLPLLLQGSTAEASTFGMHLRS